MQFDLRFLGTLNSKVRWHTNHPDVIEVNGIFSEAGIEYDEHDSISVRLKALNPGTAKIQAEFTTSTGTHTCFIEITVFKLLELELPRRITSDAIIVPPRSQINLKANLPDARFRLSEENVGGPRVSADGILRTSDRIGRDLVIVSILRFFQDEIFFETKIYLLIFFPNSRLHPMTKRCQYQLKLKIFTMYWPHFMYHHSS